MTNTSVNGDKITYLLQLLVSQRLTNTLSTSIEESQRLDWMVRRVGRFTLGPHIEHETGTQILMAVKYNSHLLVVLDRVEIVF